MAKRRRIPIKRRSLYVRHNKVYELMLAVLIVVFVAICVAVLGNSVMPGSEMWTDNVLIRMIVETNAAMRGK
ncbi:MAG: hypothetical protein LBT31_07625 [Synergistaceae bacterium]|nr:hypothetical protein [Synergistaceae bacterium]